MTKMQTEKKRPVETKTSSRRAGHPVPGLAGPLLRFNLASETEQLQHEDPYAGTPRNAKTLVKYPELRIVLIAMKSGTHIEGHKTESSIAIQTLTGKLFLGLPDQEVEIPAGSLVTLGRALPHDVKALEESSFLLTISGQERG